MTKFLKSKLGFTLVELMIVVLILGVLVAIAVPIYTSVTKKSRIKVCHAVQREIQSNVKNYCTENAFNETFTFKIKSVSENEEGILLDDKGVEYTDENMIKLLKNNVFKGDVPYCPSDGTFTIKLTKVVGGMVKIEITCDGDDGSHTK